MKKFLILLAATLLTVSAVSCTNRRKTTNDTNAYPGITGNPDYEKNFDYTYGDKAILTVLSDKNLIKRYKYWHTGSPTDFPTSEKRIKELIDILDRQKWEPLPSATLPLTDMDALLELSRVLISEKDDSTPCDVGDTAFLAYYFDFEQCTVTMVYQQFDTTSWDRYCVTDKETMNSVIEIYYYYLSIHTE